MQYPNELIRLGNANATAVRHIKTKLNELKYGPLDPNNPFYGEATVKAVQQFQKNNQLYDDGVIGNLTWDRLDSPRANRPVQSKIIRYRAVEIANTQLFVREATGKNDGAEVKAYLKSVGLTEGYAWCQSFVHWCFEMSSRDLMTKNPVPKTGGVLECLRLAKLNGASIVSSPMEGDQFIMDFGGGHGHTGLVEAVVNDNIYTVEGNTNGIGSREGDGVYERSRAIRTIKAFIRYE